MVTIKTIRGFSRERGLYIHKKGDDIYWSDGMMILKNDPNLFNYLSRCLSFISDEALLNTKMAPNTRGYNGLMVVNFNAPNAEEIFYENAEFNLQNELEHDEGIEKSLQEILEMDKAEKKDSRLLTIQGFTSVRQEIVKLGFSVSRYADEYIKELFKPDTITPNIAYGAQTIVYRKERDPVAILMGRMPIYVLTINDKGVELISKEFNTKRLIDDMN